MARTRQRPGPLPETDPDVVREGGSKGDYSQPAA